MKNRIKLYDFHLFDGEGAGAEASSAGFEQTQKPQKVEYGKSTGNDPAPSQVGSDNRGSSPEEEFAALIGKGGKFHDLYGQQVSKAIQDRFKNQQDLSGQIDQISNDLSPLFMNYGLKAGDFEGLKNAIANDDVFFQAQAERAGLDVDQYKENLRLKAEAERGRQITEAYEQQQRQNEMFAQWETEAADLQQAFPAFDLGLELEHNEEFAKLDFRKLRAAIGDDTVVLVKYHYFIANHIDWSGFDGRYVVLITDAGAIDGGSEHASTGYSAETLKADLQQKHIGLIAIHLLSGTANAKKNREGAKAQYEILSDNSFLNKPLYFQTDTADKTGFRKQVTKISDLLTAQTLHAYNGDKSIGSVITEVQEEAKKVGDNDIKRLGLAMQLEYLGKISGTRAPSVISSWISDLDLTPQHRAVVEPYVLLTKTDLSNMAGRVSGVMKAASAGVRSPDAMFNQLKDIALKMGRDPSELNGKTAFSDAVMAEYLEGLPYRSEVAAMDAEDWASLSPDQQEKFLRNMNNKLRFYRKCNEDTDKWISLAEGADHADDVYPVPLSMLP